jgi:hypothetical protein
MEAPLKPRASGASVFVTKVWATGKITIRKRLPSFLKKFHGDPLAVEKIVDYAWHPQQKNSFWPLVNLRGILIGGLSHYLRVSWEN